jgi:DNA recombination protein RmuC
VGCSLLPIDSKFPREDYDHLQEAIAAGDAKLIAQYRRDLENKIKGCAKDISRKYMLTERSRTWRSLGSIWYFFTRHSLE